eukprot:maker-scaffold759_size101470-snap-gene-0.19 protein:Tk05118 transcript:maker-scaffold759_size101470-snap-gene-0.19-mRNA-1 annotation:"conserved hypothetical protein"
MADWDEEVTVDLFFLATWTDHPAQNVTVETFSIAGPNEGTAVMAPDVPQTSNGDVIGKCLTDQFSISAPGNFAPPVVCGFNSGQHMIVDASDECHEVRFNFGGSSARTWDIKGNYLHHLQYHPLELAQSRPFQMHFKTDDAEHVQDTISVKTNEQFGIPGGIVGFNLHWELINC